MTIEPHSAFDIIRPDEVAECWDGVLAAGLYQPLWDCVNDYTAPSPEESEEPCWGMDCVADFWDRFSPEQQHQLNQLADANDEYGDGGSDAEERAEERRQLGGF
jgi:hypothetical protein